jgi:predicted ATPase
MLSNLKIKNFKALEKVDLQLGNLTLLTGLNGMGKSSLIQILLLLRQSYFYDNELIDLLLSGDLVDIGNVLDTLTTDKKILSIELATDNENYTFLSEKQSIQKDQSLWATQAVIHKDIKNIALFSKDKFQYLNAERVAPSRTYDLKNKDKLAGKLGKQGERTIQYIADLPSNDMLSEQEKSVLDKLNNEWLDVISPNAEIRAYIDNKTKKSSGFIVFREIEKNTITPEFSLVNVGFGITYILPVLVALLSAQAGELLIIENPEAHIHPKGQTRLGQLIAQTAQRGVQVIIETHSDHIFNGIRLAVKNYYNGDLGIAADKVKTYYFNRSEINHSSEITPITINEIGGIQRQPKGFFDEWRVTLNKFID